MAAATLVPEHRGDVAAPTGDAPAAGGSGFGGLTVDRLVEAIEDRVLAEIERRGGRYAGMF